MSWLLTSAAGMPWQLWFVLAVALITFDVFVVNHGLTIWFGCGALIVAAAKFLYPELTWAWQLGIFAVTSPVFLGLWKWYEKTHPRVVVSDRPHLNEKGAEYIGRVFALEGPMQNGAGRIKIGDTSWRAANDDGADFAAGEKVKAVAVRGVTIIVQKLERQPS